MAKDAGIKSISPEKALTEVTFRNVKLQTGNGPPTLDVKPGAATSSLLQSLQEELQQTGEVGQLNTPDSYWVYVGEYDSQTRQFRSQPNFDVGEPPVANSSITVTQDVYARDKKPYADAAGWNLGEIKGVLRNGKSILVLERADIEGDTPARKNIWIRIKNR